MDRVWKIISIVRIIRILSHCDIDTQSFWWHSMENYNILLGYVIMTFFYHNSCVVSFEFQNISKYVMSVHKDSFSWEH